MFRWPIVVLPALVAVLAAMIVFVLVRRLWRARFFHRVDRLREYWLRRLPELLKGGTVAPGELDLPEAREVLETLLVDRLQAAGEGERQGLLRALERTGLVDHRILLLRQGSRGDRRLSATLLGRMRAPESVDALLGTLQDSWSPLRLAALRSLAMIAGPAAGPALLRSVRKDVPAEPTIWLEAAVACVPNAEDFLPLLSDGRPELRALGARAIAESSCLVPFESLQRFAFDPDPEVRAQVLRALGRSKDERAASLLIAAANDDVWFVRLRALAALAESNSRDSLNAVLCATRDRDFRVRQKAAVALAHLAADPGEMLKLLLGGNDRYALEGFLSQLARAGLLWRTLPLLCSPQKQVRLRAREFLACAIAAGNHQEVLYAVEAHPQWRVRLAAARLLAQAGTPALVPDVEQRLAAATTARLRRVLRAILRSRQSSPQEERRAALAHPV